MHKETITYVDFLGNQRTEDFYFHLRDSDVVDWLTMEGDYTLDAVLKRLVEKRNGKAIMNSIEDLIRRSYGEISTDGRQFIRTKEVQDAFFNTEAYSQLFTKLVTDADAAAAFLKGIIPKDMADRIAGDLEAKAEEIKNSSNVIDVIAKVGNASH